MPSFFSGNESLGLLELGWDANTIDLSRRAGSANMTFVHGTRDVVPVRSGGRVWVGAGVCFLLLLAGLGARAQVSPGLARIESELKRAVGQEPESFAANHNLGEFYVHRGKLPAAVPYLEKAYRLDSSHYVNGYDLALVYLKTQNLTKARPHLRAMIAGKEAAELYNLLGAVEDQAGNFPAAADAYERAAHLEPSEQNLFDWGTVMVRRGVLEPAAEVFTHGVARYPRSAKLHLGLGVAFYARGKYEDAIQSFYTATDLNPADPEPYLFLGRAYNISAKEAQGVIERLRRFAELHPENPQAPYYYALSMWKSKARENGAGNLDRIRSLFQKAIALDPRFSDARLQLGNLYMQARRYTEAIREYRAALELQPDLAKANYRLGQAYMRTGKREKAKEEVAIYQRLHKQDLEENEKRQLEVRNFYYKK